MILCTLEAELEKCNDLCPYSGEVSQTSLRQLGSVIRCREPPGDPYVGEKGIFKPCPSCLLLIGKRGALTMSCKHEKGLGVAWV